MTTSSPARTAQRIAIALSREELYVVMRLLKASSLPGFDLDWLDAAPDGSIPAEVQKRLETATNALIARGYLTLQEPTNNEPIEAEMPSPVISLVGTCLFGEYNVLMSLYTHGEPLVMYLHALRQVGVIHTVPWPNIHQFEAVDGKPALLSGIAELLGLHAQNSAPVPSGLAGASDVQAARDATLAGKGEETETLLRRSGLAQTTVTVLSQAMREATAMGALVVVQRDEQNAFQQQTLAVVISPTTCFSLAEDDEYPDSYRVQSTSAEALRQWLTSS